MSLPQARSAMLFYTFLSKRASLILVSIWFYPFSFDIASNREYIFKPSFIFTYTFELPNTE